MCGAAKSRARLIDEAVAAFAAQVALEAYAEDFAEKAEENANVFVNQDHGGRKPQSVASV